MKKIFITLFVSLTFIFISWKYHEVKFDDPNKDKLLIELLKYVLEKGITINDIKTFHHTILKTKIGINIQNKKYNTFDTINLVQFTNGFGNLPCDNFFFINLFI